MSDTPEVKVSTVGPRMTGKTTIITGAGSGMGYASVERFLAEGGNVVGLDINDDGLAKLRELHGDDNLLTLVCDVADQDQVNDAVKAAVDRFGAVDAYFNNAGVPFVAKPIEEVTDEEWDLNMSVNLKAIFIAARAVVPVMKSQVAAVSSSQRRWQGSAHVLIWARTQLRRGLLFTLPRPWRSNWRRVRSE